MVVVCSSNFSFAAGEKISYPQLNWSFSGILGTFDRASQQRGLQVYKEVCSGCHGMRLLAYRNLKSIGYNDDEIKAFAAENSVNTINDDGEVVERPARPSDKFVSPYPNDKAARAANGGAYPRDMSVLVKARKGGSNYIYSVLMGYEDPPVGFQLDDGVLKPVTDNDVDLGTNSLELKDGYFDGTLHCDVLDLNGTEHTTIEDPTALAIALG